MKRRDLLLRRYWRREDDGTYGNVLLKEKCANFFFFSTDLFEPEIISFGLPCHSYSLPFCFPQEVSTSERQCPSMP